MSSLRHQRQSEILRLKQLQRSSGEADAEEVSSLSSTMQDKNMSSLRHQRHSESLVRSSCREALCSTMQHSAKVKDLRASGQNGETLRRNADQIESEAWAGSSQEDYQNRILKSAEMGVRDMFASTEKEGLIRYNLDDHGRIVAKELVLFEDTLLWAEHVDLEELRVKESNMELVILPLPDHREHMDRNRNMLDELIRQTIGELASL